MKHLSVLVTLLVLGALALPGCDLSGPDQGGAGDPVEISEYGGFTTSDEAPGFGDAEILDGYPEDRPFEDEMENHPDVRNGETDRRAKQYALRIIWGNLERPDSSLSDAGACPLSDWSGTIEVDGGVAVVERLILFDRGDTIFKPRKGPRKMEWTSYTKDHVDGLLLKIVDLPDPPTGEFDNTLSITTPLFSRDIPLAELEDYREYVVYDDCNAISVVATRIKASRCPKGFLEGRWVAASDTSGYFKGAWIAQHGALVGHLRGAYEIRNGERVLYGKWISESGDFQGLLRGTWTPLPREHGPSGVFEGRWVDENLDVRGFFKGHYATCPDDTAGLFHGRWMKDCK
jgi:hypothetical protein